MIVCCTLLIKLLNNFFMFLEVDSPEKTQSPTMGKSFHYNEIARTLLVLATDLRDCHKLVELVLLT